MGTKTAKIAYCEHGEVMAACLECLAMPKKVVPPPPATPRATKNPSSAKDKISPLAGELDMSLPVVDIEEVIGLPWLSARAFPHYLRRSGWIYLRSEDRLQARVKATKVIWQTERGDLADPTRDLGAGIAIEVDPKTWDADIDIDLDLFERALDQKRGNCVDVGLKSLQGQPGSHTDHGLLADAHVEKSLRK